MLPRVPEKRRRDIAYNDSVCNKLHNILASTSLRLESLFEALFPFLDPLPHHGGRSMICISGNLLRKSETLNMCHVPYHSRNLIFRFLVLYILCSNLLIRISTFLSTSTMSTPLVKEALQVEVPHVDAPEDEVSRTSRGKHSTNDAEGREAKRISQSNTAPRTKSTSTLLSSQDGWSDGPGFNNLTL